MDNVFSGVMILNLLVIPDLSAFRISSSKYHESVQILRASRKPSSVCFGSKYSPAVGSGIKSMIHSIGSNSYILKNSW
jgi:hypothetical protein